MEKKKHFRFLIILLIAKSGYIGTQMHHNKCNDYQPFMIQNMIHSPKNFTKRTIFLEQKVLGTDHGYRYVHVHPCSCSPFPASVTPVFFCDIHTKNKA